MYYVRTNEVDAVATHVAGCFKTLVFLSGRGIYMQTQLCEVTVRWY